MKTLIISSSRNPDSLSFKVCQIVHQELIKKGIEATLIDIKEKQLNFAFQKKTADQEHIHNLAEEVDNFIFGTPVYNYSISDSLKNLLDTSFPGREHKLFGTIAAAGGEKSYLSLMHLNQICMKEWRMIPLPRSIYCTKNDFTKSGNPDQHLATRINQFVEDFTEIGTKLL